MFPTRRDFLQSTGRCALGMASLASQIQYFSLLNSYAQRSIDEGHISSEGYKALVLVFWVGGNDGNNTVIPIHNDGTVSNYATYRAARDNQGLAIAQAPLIPIQVPLLNNLSYGLHPDLGPISEGINNGIHELYGLGKLAVVANVGSLVRPLTKAQYQNPAFQKPYQLFSHSDQAAQAQTSISSATSVTGWGGRMSDKMTSAQNPNGLVPMISSIAGAQFFTSGQTTLPIAITDSATPLSEVLSPAGFSTSPGGPDLARLTAFNALRKQDLSPYLVAAASHVTDLAMQANEQLQVSHEVTVDFPKTGIGRQLKQVARLIKKRTDLKMNRQIFYVQMGGFDTHTGQLNQQIALLGQFSQAIRSFHDEMAVQGVSENVTSFTMSDFSRTLNPSGSGITVGSDHAWGNHMFVIGGAVSGSDLYGSLRPDGTGSYFPTLAVSGPDDTDTGGGARGRWIPTTSVEQYAVRLARWFGLPPEHESAVFPNLANFASHDAQNGRLDFLV